MMYPPEEVTILSKLFDFIQNMTKSHKNIYTNLQEMGLKNSDEFTEIENEATNLLATCQEMKNYLNKAQPCCHHQ